MGIADMAADALDVGILFHKVLEHLILLFVAGLQGNAVRPVTLAVVIFILL